MKLFTRQQECIVSDGLDILSDLFNTEGALMHLEEINYTRMRTSEALGQMLQNVTNEHPDFNKADNETLKYIIFMWYA